MKPLIEPARPIIEMLQILLNDFHSAADRGKLNGYNVELAIHLSPQNIHLASQDSNFSAIALSIPDKAENDKDNRDGD